MLSSVVVASVCVIRSSYNRASPDPRIVVDISCKPVFRGVLIPQIPEKSTKAKTVESSSLENRPLAWLPDSLFSLKLRGVRDCLLLLVIFVFFIQPF